MKRLDYYWERGNPVAWGLLPLSWVFCVVSILRRAAYRRGLLNSRRLGVPVIVVGNISVGGTGKTPLVVWAARYLSGLGLHPGVVTRGYRGRATDWPRPVGHDGDPLMVGDEAVLLARRAGCPVMAGPDRLESGRRLMKEHGCDVILSDDGLQHYALARDMEIAVIDGVRRFGNGYCLPAGPLREPPGRLAAADIVVANGTPGPSESGMKMLAQRAINLKCHHVVRSLADFSGAEVAAVAGIGNPDRFFSMLRSFGIRVREFPFPDHHDFRPDDLEPLADFPVFMTEKDGVKCEVFAADNCWFVPVDAEPEPAFVRRFEKLMTNLRDNG